MQQVEITSINKSSLGDLLSGINEKLEIIAIRLEEICRAIDTNSRAR